MIPSTIESLQRLLFAQLWQVTLLIPLAIWGVRLACRRRSHLAYGILLAVLLKCIVPPLWSSPAGVFSWITHAVDQSEIEAELLSATDAPVPNVDVTSPLPMVTPPAKGPVSSDRPALSSPIVDRPSSAAAVSSDEAAGDSTSSWFSWGPLAAVVLWGGGILAIAGYLLAKRVYLEQFHDDTRVESESDLLKMVRDIAATLELRRHPDLIVTMHPTIPFVVGWWAPRLVVSKQIVDRSTPEEMQLIIAHELNHLRRWDTATNWFQLIVQAVWWFHPGVWWLNAEIRRWRESCCDEEVLARLKCPPARYAHTLLNVLDWQASLRVTTGFANLSPLEVTKQRLLNIMQPAAQFPRSAPLTVWLMFGVLTFVFLPGAQFSSQPQTAEAHDEIPNRLLVAVTTLEGPPPPAAVPAATDRPAIFVTPTAPPAVVPLPVVPAGVPEAVAAPPRAAWRYKPDVQRTFSYRVSIEEDGLHGVTRHSGQPAVRVTYISGGQWQLSIQNSELMASELPSSVAPLRRTRPPRIPSPFERGYEATISSEGVLVDEQGNGTLPLYLGQWSSWLFRPLPRDVEAQWTTTGEVQLTSWAEPTLGPFGDPDPSPFARPRVSSRQRATWKSELAQQAEGDLLTLTSVRTLRTADQINNEPTIEISEESRWQFDAQQGMPTSLTGMGTLIQRQLNRETKTPFEYSVELVTDEVSANAPAE